MKVSSKARSKPRIRGSGLEVKLVAFVVPQLVQVGLTGKLHHGWRAAAQNHRLRAWRWQHLLDHLRGDKALGIGKQ